MYVLDTNTVLDYFRGKGSVADNLLAVPPSDVALPAIVAYEVWVGVLGSQNARRRHRPARHAHCSYGAREQRHACHTQCARVRASAGTQDGRLARKVNPVQKPAGRVVE